MAGKATLELDRSAVLAYRAAVQNLSDPAARIDRVAVLGLGAQDTPRGSGLEAVRVRSTRKPERLGEILEPGGAVALVLTVRGAPHAVLRSEMGLMKAAVYPLLPEEAEAVDTVADAMREVSGGGEISRPDLSAALNDCVPEALRSYCERCGSTHVREDLFRKSTLQADLEVDPASSSPTVFRPLPFTPMPDVGAEIEDRDEARTELIRRYVRLVGVTRPDEVAAWLGYKPGEIRPIWSTLDGELVEVRVDGKRRFALDRELDAISDAEGAEGVRLLPPSDPFLLGDRALVVPERADQRSVWRPVGNPGVVLVDGQIVGTWRRRMSGGRLEVTATAFSGFGAFGRSGGGVGSGIEAQAQQVAALRGVGDVSVVLAD